MGASQHRISSRDRPSAASKHRSAPRPLGPLQHPGPSLAFEFLSPCLRPGQPCRLPEITPMQHAVPSRRYIILFWNTHRSLVTQTPTPSSYPIPTTVKPLFALSRTPTRRTHSLAHTGLPRSHFQAACGLARAETYAPSHGPQPHVRAGLSPCAMASVGSDVCPTESDPVAQAKRAFQHLLPLLLLLLRRADCCTFPPRTVLGIRIEFWLRETLLEHPNKRPSDLSQLMDLHHPGRF